MAKRQQHEFADAALWRVNDDDRNEVVDDVVLPWQYLAQPTRDQPEKTLALCVFSQALQDACGRRVGIEASDDRDAIRAEARAWIESDDTSHVFAFVSICDLFGWN